MFQWKKIKAFFKLVSTREERTDLPLPSYKSHFFIYLLCCETSAGTSLRNNTMCIQQALLMNHSHQWNFISFVQAFFFFPNLSFQSSYIFSSSVSLRAFHFTFFFFSLFFNTTARLLFFQGPCWKSKTNLFFRKDYTQKTQSLSPSPAASAHNVEYNCTQTGRGLRELPWKRLQVPSWRMQTELSGALIWQKSKL